MCRNIHVYREHSHWSIEMFKINSCYYVLCRVFLLLFPLRMAALLHRKLAMTDIP